MTPKQAYEHVAMRSRRMLRFHDGLVNTRQRGMRKDWKSAFCKLMRWPQSSQIDRIDSADAVIVLRAGGGLTANDFTSDSVDDLLRSALALGLSALDRYVHERVCKAIVHALRATKLSASQEKLTVPAVLSLRMIDALRSGYRNGDSVRPANQFRNAFQETLHRRTFQSASDLDEAFRMIGVDRVWGRLQIRFGVPDVAPVKLQLDAIAHRRNLIVHEGDLVRHQRGGRPRMNRISKQYVHQSLSFLDTLVGHLDAL